MDSLNDLEKINLEIIFTSLFFSDNKAFRYFSEFISGDNVFK
ncbi:MAG TPA: hypothetical protein PKN32_02065 [Bacteroidales bacterium]|nr:hypothetical protein [Bacteroidales bacterium]